MNLHIVVNTKMIHSRQVNKIMSYHYYQIISSSQDGGIGRHTSPSYTSIERTTQPQNR